ncbi:OLC1v1022157C1 [Oldenlandia corymbosa var. corymbosa]|uniref:OLC1v1022157C1 n=1 Tax=Oldenlandia corymbosa var. corymbosa TaxID=529605 RepID=A0AAV1BX90_OLDCO|nr:OLC1v1022157C1 [Oldenlandia corymbosa var. corymbosa]
MTVDEGKTSGVSVTVDASSGAEPAFSRQYYYGTFQGVNSQPPMPSAPPPPASAPVVGFPQPIPPPGTAVPSPYYYHQHVGYQAVPGYAVAEGIYVVPRRLPCCGIGIGWLLFIFGFFLGAVPWYIGAFLLMCARLDHREKPGLFACTLAAILALVAISLGVTKATNAW